MKRLAVSLVALSALIGCSSSSPSSPGPVGASLNETSAAVKPPGTPKNFVAHLTGDGEVPARETQAQGQIIFQLNGSELSYRLISSNIENVVASHIHVGSATENGPVVQFLFGNVPPGGGRTDGVLATGTIDGTSLVGPLAGQGLSALIAEMVAGNTYVNVHTNDGVAPTNTGAGDFPGGEIRGQIRPIGDQ
jgi:hypothetical protein